MALTRRLKLLQQELFSYPQVKITATSTDYESYWRTKRGTNPLHLSSFQLSRAKIVASLIQPKSNVIDIGSGNCAILNWLIQHCEVNAHAIDCSDFSRLCADTLKIDFTKLDINSADAVSQIPKSDYLLLLELIEHLPTPENLLPQLIEKCNRGLIFSVPNSGYFIHRLRFLFGRTPCQWTVYPGEHLRFWTSTDLTWWLTALGIPSAKRKLHFYEGIPILNKLLPSLFAKAIVVLIKKDHP